MAARRISTGSRGFLLPLLWVFLLVATYWLLAEWQSLPNLLASMKAGFPHWRA